MKLRDGLADGTYTVAWRVVSADSHPISGAFTFSIGKPSATTAAVAVEPAVNPASGALYDIARYAAYGAVALLIGSVTFVLACRPHSAVPLRGLLRAGWWILLATTVALLFLRGPYARGTGPSTAFDPELIENTLTTRPGWALLARLALLAGAAVFLVRLVPRMSLLPLGRAGADKGADEDEGPSSDRDPVPDAGRGGGREPEARRGRGRSAAGRGSGGHLGRRRARVRRDPGPRGDDLLRTASAGDGGLAGRSRGPAHHVPAVGIPPTAASVARFSRMAFASVTVLVVTGVYQSWRGLGSWDAVFGTSYGRILVAKVCAVVVVLVAAGFSRRWTAQLTDAKSR